MSDFGFVFFFEEGIWFKLDSCKCEEILILYIVINITKMWLSRMVNSIHILKKWNVKGLVVCWFFFFHTFSIFHVRFMYSLIFCLLYTSYYSWHFLFFFLLFFPFSNNIFILILVYQVRVLYLDDKVEVQHHKSNMIYIRNDLRFWGKTWCWIPPLWLFSA